MFEKIKRNINHPEKIIIKLGRVSRLIPDKLYLQAYYYNTFGKRLNLKHPKTFNEKLQWLKLYDRRPEYTIMVDKYLVRDYVSRQIGDEHLIPLLGVWDDPDEIDFEALPNQFVLKCNHNSAVGMCICRDKSELDIGKVKDELRKGLGQDYYLSGREWPYKDVPRKIICEKYMTDNPKSHDFTDYKFFCFNGNVESVMVCFERSSGDTKYYFFDRSWDLCRYNIRGKKAPENFTLQKPKNMITMFDIASKLSEGLPFARIDLYNSEGHIYFGEITFFPDSGFDKNILPETDAYWGSLVRLPR